MSPSIAEWTIEPSDGIGATADSFIRMQNPQVKDDEADSVRVWTLALWLPVAVLGGVAVLAGGYLLVSVVTVGIEKAFEPATVEARIRTTILLLGVVAASVTLVFALRRQIVSERALRISRRDLNHRESVEDARASEVDRAERQRLSELSHERERERIQDLRSRYVTCAQQLASESEAVRLAGAYGMAQLASDWDEIDARQSCVDVLCAYLRLNNAHSLGSTEYRREEEVRRSTIRILAAGLNPRSSAYWDGVRIDLRGAHLSEADFCGARFPNDADFSNTQIATRARFNEAEFVGRASFTGAEFLAESDFSKAIFSDTANFARVQFLSRASFSAISARQFDAEACEFKGLANFAAAKFARRLNLSSSRFSAKAGFASTVMGRDAVFANVEFEADADFFESRIAGGLSFAGVRGKGRLRLDHATVGGNVGFADVFVRGEISAREATVRGAVKLRDVQTDSDIHLEGASLQGGLIIEASTVRGQLVLARVRSGKATVLKTSTFGVEPNWAAMKTVPAGDV